MRSPTPAVRPSVVLAQLAVLAAAVGCKNPVPLTVPPPAGYSAPEARDVKLEVGDTIQIGYFKSYGDAGPYHLQVGDALKVVFGNRAELNQEVVVLPDGTCVFPLLGNVSVRGKTVGDLRDELIKLYGASLKTPTLDLLVVKARSAIEDFFSILRDSSGGPVREVTLTEHGYIDLPLLSQIKVLGRPISEVREEVQAGYRTVMPELRVTFSLKGRLARTITVLGEVQRPGNIQYALDTSTMRALAQAGGITDRAWTSQVIVAHREEDGTLEVKVYDLNETLGGREALGYTTMLKPDDIVYVPRSRIADINVWVDQYLVKMLPVHPAAGVGVGFQIGQSR